MSKKYRNKIKTIIKQIEKEENEMSLTPPSLKFTLVFFIIFMLFIFLIIGIK